MIYLKPILMALGAASLTIIAMFAVFGLFFMITKILLGLLPPGGVFLVLILAVILFIILLPLFYEVFNEK